MNRAFKMYWPSDQLVSPLEERDVMLAEPAGMCQGRGRCSGRVEAPNPPRFLAVPRWKQEV